MSRLAKQVIIACIFAIIFALVLFGLYRLFVPSPSCTDGIQNQNEEGVDCGVVCGSQCPVAQLPLQVKGTDIISSGADTADVIVQVYNSNDVWGAARAPFAVVLADATGATVGQRSGFVYVSPKQTRYVVQSFAGLPSAPSRATVTVSTDVQWVSVDAVRAAAAVNFSVRNESYGAVTEPGVAYRYTSLVHNASSYDFENVDIAVLLYDDQGSLIGAGSTVLRTILAGTDRGIAISWPAAPAGTVASVRVFATTNVFENSNFIRDYGTPGRF